MGDFVICDHEQGTEGWFADRAGVISASMFSVARARLKSGKQKGQPTAEARKYAFRLALERISGRASESLAYETWQMRRGRELEPDARRLHSFQYGLEVREVGFLKTTCGRFGASPDGLIEPAGGCEYKCFTDPDKVREILLDGDASLVMDQMQGGMMVSGRDWWHLGLYCPDLWVIGYELEVIPAERDQAYIEALREDLERFDAVVEDYVARLHERATMPLKHRGEGHASLVGA